MLTRLSMWRWLALLFLVAFTVRIVWAGFMLERLPRFDEVHFVGHAERLCAGQGYVDRTGQPASYWPIGFPALLAASYCLIGVHAITGYGLQILLGVLTCVLVWYIGERYLSPAIGRVAALVLALYPTHISYSTLYLTEPLFTLLLLACCALLLASLRNGAGFALAAGAVLGLAILTRTVLLLLPGVLLFWYLQNGVTLKRALLLCGLIACAAAVVVSPWVLRNNRLFGTWTEISGNGGLNFLAGNHRGAWGGYTASPQFYEALQGGRFEESDRNYRLAFEAMRARPADVISRGVQKVTYFFALETDGVLWNLKGLSTPAPMVATLALLAAANAAYLLVVWGCTLGLLTPTKDEAVPRLFLWLTGYLVLIAVAYFGDPRYHHPLIPLATLLFSKALLTDGPALWAGLLRADPEARHLLRRWLIVNAALILLMIGNLGLKYLENRAF